MELADNLFESGAFITYRDRIEMFNTSTKKALTEEPSLFNIIHAAQIRGLKKDNLKKGKLLKGIDIKLYNQYKDYYSRDLLAVFTTCKLIKIPRIIKPIYNA